MDDSMINPILLSSSIHLKNVEELIKNLEKQTVNIDNLEDILNNQTRQEIISKSFSSLNDDFLVKSLKFPSDFSMESFLIQPESSSTSWRQMKESQRVITDIETKEIRSSSPLNLYKIFQQKSNTKFHHHHPSTPTRNSSFHKSLPDLSFISNYSKELSRSLTTSPLLQTSSTNIARTTPSPTLIHQYKQDSDRPRTLKSIKRYKNSKHSTEPLSVFYSPQLRRTLFKSPQTFNLQSSSREHHSENDLTSKTSVNMKISSNHPSNDQFSSSTKRYKPMRRCQTDIILVDPILHRCSLTDSPPNEFCLQQEDKSLLNLDEPVPITDQSFIAMNSSILDHLLERISGVIKRLLELKQSDKTFFLNNEQNLQLDSLLKNDLCPAIQTILEHGRKDLKKITLWKIIQISISSPVYSEAKQIAQNASSYWLYRFQAFIFALLNKNELINWLYYFTRQKDIIQRYYQSPDALILVSTSSTFNYFERMMTQLEKLTSLTFHLTYHPPSHDEQFNTSFIPMSTRDWMMTLSRRTSKTFPQPDTFRSTLSRKLNSFFMKNQPEQGPTYPRPLLNVDKPKSVRYRARTLPSK